MEARFAHQALVSAVVLGVMAPRRKHVRVTVGEMKAIAAGGAGTGADLVVMTDAGAVAEADLAVAAAGVRAALGDGDAVALVVASPVTVALSRVARDQAPLEASREDAYALAVGWAAERGTAMAPGFDADRLGRILEAMAERGLMLVEPEIGIAAPGLTRVRGMRSARGRALLATIALGASARPLLFVPSARAPKGGLARAKAERLVDGWVGAPAFAGSLRSVAAAPDVDASPAESDLARAAVAVLEDAARSERGPMPFKELLREARERWSVSARARGGRATQSTTDAPELTASLLRLAAEERVALWMLDPAAPAWTLTTR